MRTINLSAVPSQIFSARLDDIHITIRLKECDGVMLVDIDRDGQTIIKGQRALAGEPLIPFHYLESGNFILLTESGDLPTWEKFGVTQTLVYLTKDEITAIRDGKV